MYKTLKFKNFGNYLYIIPSVLVVVAIMGFPVVYNIFLSFFESNIYSEELSFAGISTYIDIIKDPIFILAMKNTVIWTVLSVLFQIIIGCIAALTLNQNFIKGRGILRVLLLVSWVLPSIVGVTLWKWMYHADFGIINEVLKFFGIVSENISWLSGVNTALYAAIIVNVWKYFPFTMLFIEASLQNVPKEIEEAARLDGANSIRTFTHIKLPHISGTLITLTLLLIIWAFNNFVFIFILTRGGPAHYSTILPIYIWKIAFQNFNFGKASTASMILFIIIMIFTVFYNKFLNKED
jgi:multiple sugar transport system permease protein